MLLCMSEVRKTPAKMKDPLLARHNSEMARAAALAMAGNHAETVEACSELLTSELYPDMEKAGKKEAARRCRAEVRLMLGSAMHFTDSHYEDIVRVLTYALDSPADIRKDALFTLAIVHQSFGHEKEAEAAMERCRVELSALQKEKGATASDCSSWEQQDKEAAMFLEGLKKSVPKHGTN